MDTMPMFPFEQFEQDASQKQEDGIGRDPAAVPARDRTDDLASIGEEHEPDRTEIAAPNPQGSTEPDAEATGTSEQVSVRKTSPVFEATGLTGDFELSDHAFAFPDTSHEDIVALARDIEATGLLEEITLAWPQEPGGPPEIVDGKRRLRACKTAGVEPTYRLLRREIDPRDYVWSKNGESRDLEPSQKAMAFALLFPKLPLGRPPLLRENCRTSDNYSSPTQGQGAKAKGVSRDLINFAYKVADPNGRVAPEIRDAVRDGTVSMNAALSEQVVNASKEVQRQALSQVKEGKSRTIPRAIDELSKKRMQRDHQTPSRLHTPTTLGRRAEFHCGFVDDLQRFVEPGRVDLVIAHPPEFVSMTYYSHIAELADHALSEAGVLVVVVPAGAPLHGILNRLHNKKRGFEFIAEFSLLSPIPFTDLGDPHYTRVRRAALLVYGKRGTILPAGDDIILVPGPTGDMAEDDFMEIGDCLPLVVHRFARTGQTVLFPTLSDSRDAVAASLELGCTVIGADQDQSVIDVIVREASEPTQSASADQESE